MSLRKYHIDFFRSRRMVLLMLLCFLVPAGPFLSCESEDWMLNVSCSDCFDHRPDSANLIVYLSLDAENDSIPLTFYRGDASGEIDWQDTAIENEFHLPSEVGRTYTVKATYRSNGRIIEAFDSDHMSIQDYGNECGSPCFMVRGGIFELRLAQ